MIHPTLAAAPTDGYTTGQSDGRESGDPTATTHPPAGVKATADRTKGARTMRRTIAALLAAAATIAVPAGHAAQAQASTSKDGCTVTPKTPYVLPTLDTHGHKQVYYPLWALGGRAR